jgi:hypothetical protein
MKEETDKNCRNKITVRYAEYVDEETDREEGEMEI